MVLLHGMGCGIPPGLCHGCHREMFPPSYRPDWTLPHPAWWEVGGATARQVQIVEIMFE